jgi:hypothetical protein
MYAQKIATLKHSLLHSKNFAEVQDYFLTHFAEDPQFLNLGQPVQSKLLETIFRQLIEQAFKSSKNMSSLLFIRVPEYQFIHGTGFVEGRVLTAFFFEEESVGLAAMASLAPGGETNFARFKAAQ